MRLSITVPIYRQHLVRRALFSFFLSLQLLLQTAVGRPDDRKTAPPIPGRTLSRMLEVHATLPPNSRMAREIARAIAEANVFSAETQALKDSFLREKEERSAQAQKRLREAGFSEEDAKIYSQSFTLERAIGYRKIDSTPFIPKEFLQKLSDARTFPELEETLSNVVNRCDRWYEAHHKLALASGLAECPEPKQTCAMNARSMQRVIDLSAKAYGLEPPKISKKVHSLLLDRKNRDDLRDHWTSLVGATAAGNLVAETGRLGLFQSLEEAKIIPGNVVRSMGLGLRSTPSTKETLQAIRAEIDFAAVALRGLAKDGEHPQLFDLISNGGEHFARCETLHDGPSQIPFLMRLDIFNAVLGFEKELTECIAGAKSPVDEATLAARKFELESLRSLGLDNLVRKETRLLARIWKTLSPDLREKLVRILEARAKYEGQLAIADYFREPAEPGTSRYLHAVQKISAIYLSEERLKQFAEPDPREDLSPENSRPPLTGDAELELWPRGGTRQSPEDIRVLKIDPNGEKSGTAIVEFTLPDGEKRVVSASLKAFGGSFYLMGEP